ncbi:MAG: hypothetical protein Q8O24_06180 [Gallionellaceae bacterium]|nr:hypothetical protein [Gallionellaceae bacterium]
MKNLTLADLLAMALVAAALAVVWAFFGNWLMAASMPLFLLFVVFIVIASATSLIWKN